MDQYQQSSSNISVNICLCKPYPYWKTRYPELMAWNTSHDECKESYAYEDKGEGGHCYKHSSSTIAKDQGMREEMSSEEKATSTDSVGQSMKRERDLQHAQVKHISSLLCKKDLSAYQLLMRLCCRIKLLSWPEGILQEQKAAELKGRSKEHTTQKPKGKGSSQEVPRGKLDYRTANFGDRRYIF
ncbi:hypothetical protein TURU_016435 [Turdus rufiventris]|nr:hypothetical protein TURU_016435 [Turdus rufiventris]